MFFSFFYLMVHLFLLGSMVVLGKSIFFYMNFDLELSLGMKYDILGDYMSLGFLGFVSLITFSVMKYSYDYMGMDFLSKRFIILVTFFVISMFLLILSPSFLMIMLGWDGLGVTSFLLVIYYNNYSSLVSGLLTIYLNRIGDFLMMLTFWGLYKNLVYCNIESYMSKSLIVFSLILVMAAGTKSAQLPFSSWLPAAMAAPTPVSSLVHSSTLVTAGVYLLLRFFYLGESDTLSSLLMWVGLLTCMGSGIIACCENDIKKLVAMSTLSQLGLMVYIFSYGEVFYSFYHMVCHALFKALLFLSCGICISNLFGLQDSRGLTKLGSFLGGFLILLGISVISLMGFPFMTGFYSKDSILEVSLSEGSSFFSYLFLFISCILTGIYALKGYILVVYSQAVSALETLSSSTFTMLLGMFLLSGWSIFLGKCFGLILERLEAELVLLLMKMGGLLIVFLGISFSLMNIWLHIFSYSMKSFFLDMFFLNWLYGGNVTRSLEMSLNSMMGELSWLSLLIPKMLYGIINIWSLKPFTYLGGVKISFMILLGAVFMFL